MNKRIAILGAGESGVGTAILAKQQGYDVFVSDMGNIHAEYKRMLEHHAIPFEEGRHTESQILIATEVMKSPGIPEKAEIIKKIRTQGIPVISEIEFAYRFKGDATIVAITGSNGKTTTTSLIHYIFKQAGLNAALVGNIGHSFALQVAQNPSPYYVIEVSSFQLDDIVTFRPDVAIITNITPDHLDRYNYQFDNYVASKFRIAMNMTEQDKLILCQDDPATTQYLLTHTFKPQILFFTMNEELKSQDGAFVDADGNMTIQYGEDKQSMSIQELSLKGKHNLHNSMAAGISARIMEIRNDKIRESLSGFNSLEHRMEYVATVRGVDYINDSKATNINSVWFALESQTQPTVLILGGVDKGNDYSVIEELVSEKVKAIVCMGLDNAPILKAFEGKVKAIIETQSAKAAVQAAYSLAEKGDVVLLSPACASFDLFKNYEDRGRQFKEAVRNL